jgi:hypothetical protein
MSRRGRGRGRGGGDSRFNNIPAFNYDAGGDLDFKPSELFPVSYKPLLYIETLLQAGDDLSDES